MKKTYYILAIDYGRGYGVEFGAYDKADVKEEQQFQTTENACWPVNDYFKTKVIKTIDDQRAIDEAINKLNKKG
jgi:hypothetical protein